MWGVAGMELKFSTFLSKCESGELPSRYGREFCFEHNIWDMPQTAPGTLGCEEFFIDNVFVFRDSVPIPLLRVVRFSVMCLVRFNELAMLPAYS
jgi:hypothetical protein